MYFHTLQPFCAGAERCSGSRQQQGTMAASAALRLLWGSLPHQELCIPGEHSPGKHLPTLAPTLDLIALRLQLVLLSSLLVLAHLSLSSPRAADLSL